MNSEDYNMIAVKDHQYAHALVNSFISRGKKCHWERSNKNVLTEIHIWKRRLESIGRDGHLKSTLIIWKKESVQ